MEQVKIDGEPDLHTVDLTVRTVACQYQLEGRPVSEIGLRTIIQVADTMSQGPYLIF